MLVLTLLWILSVITPGSCSKCWIILNEPSGLNNFDIELDKLLNGIVTIEGVLNLDHAPESGVPHKDLLKFIGEDDSNDAPILEIETQVNRRHQCMFIEGTLKDENLSSMITYPFLSNRKYICSENRDGSMKISQDNEVKLQISSIDMETLEGYEVYLGGFAKLLKHHLFKYGSLENWQKFEDRRIDGTRRIVNTCKQDCHLSYTKISVCSDPQPKLLDKIGFQVVRAELGSTYTLSCSASGAPYLGSDWRDKENSIIPGDEVFSSDGAEFLIESKLVISDFYTKDAGSYTCNIFNKNFGNGVEKLVSLQHLSISAPNSTYSFADSESTELVWTVRGHPLLEVKLECKSELGVSVPFYQRLEYSPLRLTFSYEFSKEDAPAMLSCVLLNGTEFLDQRTIMRDDEDANESTEIPAPPCEAGVKETGCICWYGYLAFGMLALSVICNLALTAIMCKSREGSFNMFKNKKNSAATVFYYPLAENIEATEGNPIKEASLPSSSLRADGSSPEDVLHRIGGSEFAGLSSADTDILGNDTPRKFTEDGQMRKRIPFGSDKQNKGTQTRTEKRELHSAPPAYDNKKDS